MTRTLRKERQLKFESVRFSIFVKQRQAGKEKAHKLIACRNYKYDTELKLQEAIKQSEEEIQMRARELFKLVDSVSKYKEHVGSKISETKRDLWETAIVVSEAYRSSFPVDFNNILNANRQL